MNPLAKLNIDSPEWLCQQFDLPTRRLLFRPMTADGYRRSLFLDQRLCAASDQQQIISLDDCEDALAQLPLQPATWVFHVGHCGSTYLSRMLEQLAGLLALREPMTLRAMAAFQRDLQDPLSLMDPDHFEHWLQLHARLLSRRYDGALPTLIKATSDCAPLAAPLLATHRDHRAVRVGLSLEQYLKTMLRSELRREELYHFAQSRLADLQALNLANDSRLYRLSPGELAAMCWLSVNRVLDAINGEQTLAVDFDQFLQQPETWLTTIAQFLELPASPDVVAAVARGEVSRGYSKDPSMRYDADLRAEELARSNQANRAEIEAGLTWAQTAQIQFRR